MLGYLTYLGSHTSRPQVETFAGEELQYAVETWRSITDYRETNDKQNPLIVLSPWFKYAKVSLPSRRYF